MNRLLMNGIKRLNQSTIIQSHYIHVLDPLEKQTHFKSLHLQKHDNPANI